MLTVSRMARAKLEFDAIAVLQLQAVFREFCEMLEELYVKPNVIRHATHLDMLYSVSYLHIHIHRDCINCVNI